MEFSKTWNWFTWKIPLIFHSVHLNSSEVFFVFLCKIQPFLFSNRLNDNFNNISDINLRKVIFKLHKIKLVELKFYFYVFCLLNSYKLINLLLEFKNAQPKSYKNRFSIVYEAKFDEKTIPKTIPLLPLIHFLSSSIYFNIALGKNVNCMTGRL